MTTPPTTREEALASFSERFAYKTVTGNDHQAMLDFIDDVLTTATKEMEEAVREALGEYKAFVLNVLDGVDIADGYCNTKAIRFALHSRTITTATPPEKTTSDKPGV